MVHYTAKPNITRTWGKKPAELTLAQILLSDSVDYLLGGSMVMKNGRVDKYLFEGGYAQASVATSTTDKFAFYYYNRDHLGSIREVVDASGKVKQVTNYYPFGAPYADTSSSTNPDFQPYKYNGKELDRMHGLDTYDYGARQHDPILARWDRMDPLCEKTPEFSPYNYCNDNPIKNVDPDGRETGIPLPGIYAGFIISGNHNIKTLAFYITHPQIAKSIGSPKVKGTISNTASNFEINITKGVDGLEHGSPGDEGNAIRHTAWQAMITKAFGEQIASTVADCHEDDWKLTNQEKVFKDKEVGDTYVDFKNNEIGRSIGKNNPKATNKQLIIKVMEHYQSKGLYELKKVGNVWQPVLNKISKQQLQQAIQIIQTKDENGLNK